ncbi:hypothetical protein D3C84_436990 [compost metagenome]
MQGHLQAVVEGRLGLGAGFRRRGAELEFAARAQFCNRPVQAVLVDKSAQALGQACGQRQHVGVGGLGHYRLQVGAHAVHGQGVGREGGAHAAVAMAMAVFAGMASGALHGLGHFRAAAIDRAGHAAGDGLAEGDEVRRQVPAAGAAAGAGGDGVGLVDDQQAAVLAGQFAQALHVAGLGQDHADIGHRRLAEHRGDVALGQGRFQRGEVVEGHRAAVAGQVVGLADQPGAVHGAAFAATHHDVVHRAVVAAIEYQQHLAPGNGAGPAHYEAVGVGGGGRYLPVGQAETFGQQLAGDHGVFAGKHGGQAVGALFGDGAGDGLGGVAEHAAGVAQAEVHVLVAVHVMETRAFGVVHEQRAGGGPVAHPVHGHAAEQRMAGALGQGDGLRILLHKALALAGGQGCHSAFGDATGSHV